MQLSALKDMPVVSLADGTKVGAVRDVLVDTAALRVVTLVLEGSEGTALLPFAATNLATTWGTHSGRNVGRPQTRRSRGKSPGMTAARA